VTYISKDPIKIWLVLFQKWLGEGMNVIVYDY